MEFVVFRLCFFFKGGQIVEQKVGAIGKPEFQKMLDKHI